MAKKTKRKWKKLKKCVKKTKSPETLTLTTKKKSLLKKTCFFSMENDNLTKLEENKKKSENPNFFTHLPSNFSPISPPYTEKCPFDYTYLPSIYEKVSLRLYLPTLHISLRLSTYLPLHVPKYFPSTAINFY